MVTAELRKYESDDDKIPKNKESKKWGDGKNHELPDEGK